MFLRQAGMKGFCDFATVVGFHFGEHNHSRTKAWRYTEVAFSMEQGTVDSIHRGYKVTWKEPHREMIVPVTINLTRLPSADILAYEEKVRAAQARSEAHRGKTEAQRVST